MILFGMAFIETISPTEADATLAEVYRSVSPKGHVANILRLQSLSPKTLDTHYRFYRALMFGKNPLRRAQRELLAVAVSQANRCHY